MKKLAKSLAMAVVFALVSPAGFGARLAYAATRSSIAFDCFAQAFSQVPGVLGRYTRTAFYRQALRQSSWSSQYCFGSVVTKIEARIGRNTYVGLYSSVGLAEIGDDAVLANYVSVLSGGRQHNFEDPDAPIFSGDDTFAMVRIGSNTFLGDKVTVMADVGRACIIAAGAVVTRDIPDYSVAAGVPARVVRDRRVNQRPSH